MLDVTRTSMTTGITRTRSLDITEEQYLNWRQGMKIQDAFPQLSLSDREFLITGMTDDEWDNAFEEEEDA
jgi:hypothetical protein